MDEAPILSVRDLSVTLAGPTGGRRLLEGISFDIAPREIVGVVGATGSGKTVLAKAVVNGLEPALSPSGTVRFRGRDILGLDARAMRPLRREIAYVGANPMGALDPTLPVGRQIAEKLRAVAPGVTQAEAGRRWWRSWRRCGFPPPPGASTITRRNSPAG